MRIIDSNQKYYRPKLKSKVRPLSIIDRPRWIFGRREDKPIIFGKSDKKKYMNLFKRNATVNIESIIKNDMKKVPYQVKNEKKDENEDIIHDKNYLHKLEKLIVNLTDNEMIFDDHSLPLEFESYGKLWDITILNKDNDDIGDPRYDKQYGDLFEELLMNNPFDYLTKFKAFFMKDYTKLIESECKIREEAFKGDRKNFFVVIDSLEIDEYEGISMIWRVYMYFVSSIEPVISKDAAIEILKVFVNKDNNSDEMLIEKLKRILLKLPKNEYLNIKLLMGHIYRIGCLSRRYIFYGLSYIFGNYIFRKAWESFHNSEELLMFLDVTKNKKKEINKPFLHKKHLKNIDYSNVEEKKENNTESNDAINPTATEVIEKGEDADKNKLNIIIDDDYNNPLAIRDPLCTDAPNFLYFFAKLDPKKLFMVIYLRIIILDFPSYAFYFLINKYEAVFSWSYSQTSKKIQLFKI
ncbi:hypothetical protein BCR36DRAFT_414886 [Piromyces finnis]|uniref:Uncharacterized protein n=1 Tax=Piromyces finnis TaxID=1754191 RepID=A0A1Y1V1M3_9FUNG|nr:hypothetical protein BCR36DRAFT_414886 [Piromyces finnis]|eukprot:ORX44650.1 hypothetical protein BCR36DRAFT_414886 [Piromyces finnis]